MSNALRPVVGVIDYGIGNLASLLDAFVLAGVAPSPVTSARDVVSFDRFVLPGVGSFSAAMMRLRQGGWIEPILRSVAEGKLMLGVCVGMQLMFDKGYEDGETEGLGLIAGSVTRFPNRPEFKVPHMGWNSLETSSVGHPLISKLKSDVDVYFCHSYYCEPLDPGVVVAQTFHGLRFASVVAKDNVVGVQFHPEKSQSPGLRILQEFASGQLTRC